MSTPTMSTADINKLCRATIKQKWPTWPAKQCSIKKDAHGNHTTIITWTDHCTRLEMNTLLGAYSAPERFSYAHKPFTVEGKEYNTHTLISCYRSYTAPFLTRVATIFCRQHQVPMPQLCGPRIWGEVGSFIRAEENEPQVKGHPLSKAIMLYAQSLNEWELDALEKETEGITIPEADGETQQQREKLDQARKLHAILSLERQRQSQQFASFVFLDIDKQDKYLEVAKAIETLQASIKAFSDGLQDPVVCNHCARIVNRSQMASFVHPEFRYTFYRCDRCTDKNTVFAADPHVLEEEAALDLGEQKQDEEYTPTTNEHGLYLAKNGRPMPVLTRDLLHDVRVSRWWLWFDNPVGREHVTSPEVWEALKAEGWRWGYNRKQYYHANQFGVLKIPEIIYEQYGGYIDGGFCDYRSTRGERLRAYAGRVEDKADQMAAWSESIVEKYMSGGSIITGGRRTRKLQKEKRRAERKAEEARRLDAYANDLYNRANSSEAYQFKLASNSMLYSRLETLETDTRKLEKDFLELVTHASRAIITRSNGYQQHSVRWLVHEYYEYVLPRKEIIQDEYDLINAMIEARKEQKKKEPEKPVPVEAPEQPERAFSVEGVIEVNVGDNRTNLFPTHPDIAKMILDRYPIPNDSTVLEPNGGTGVLLEAMRGHLVGTDVPIHTYELLYDLNKRLIDQGYTVLGSDYLESELPPGIAREGGYGDIFMNPPFNAWEKHLLHAWKQLRPGGRLRCILPLGAGTSRLMMRLHDVVAQYEQWDLPEDAFKSSGTSVRTIVIYLTKVRVKEVIETPMVVPVAPVIAVEQKKVPSFLDMPLPSTQKKKREVPSPVQAKQESLF